MANLYLYLNVPKLLSNVNKANLDTEHQLDTHLHTLLSIAEYIPQQQGCAAALGARPEMGPILDNKACLKTLKAI